MAPDRAIPPLSTRLETARLVLRPPHPTDVPAVRRLLRGNAEHLRPWSPVPRAGEDPSSLTEISKGVIRQRREWTKGEAFVFFITSRSRGEAPIGRVAFTAVVRGAFLSTHLGYWIEADSQGQGLMTEAVGAAVTFAFDAVGLHRVQAAVMPTNVPSLRVLAKLGFRKEGESLRYLQIAGTWEDHHLFATTVEEWAPRREPTSRSG
jgi:[ribosomal protein S5]-alanine N-acetyltransferase